MRQSPDADTIKFKAIDASHWNKIDTEFRDTFNENFTNENGVVPLRLQGIDALETHYSLPTIGAPEGVIEPNPSPLEKPRAGSFSQLLTRAEQAADSFLAHMGVTKITWRSAFGAKYIYKATITVNGQSTLVEEKYKDNLPGYIIASDVEKNGRPLAWIFKGDLNVADGVILTKVQTAQLIDRSANHYLLREGLVYPYFFMTLPGVLRQKLALAAQAAQQDAAAKLQTGFNPQSDTMGNIWLQDRTATGAPMATVSNMTDDFAVYPYLFRKILKYWYAQTMKDYWEALRTKQISSTWNPYKVTLDNLLDDGNPYLFVVSDQDFVRLDDVLELENGQLKLLKYPYDLVFLQ